jgi:hypothetical protein
VIASYVSPTTKLAVCFSTPLQEKPATNLLDAMFTKDVLVNSVNLVILASLVKLRSKLFCVRCRGIGRDHPGHDCGKSLQRNDS